MAILSYGFKSVPIFLTCILLCQCVLHVRGDTEDRVMETLYIRESICDISYRVSHGCSKEVIGFRSRLECLLLCDRDEFCLGASLHTASSGSNWQEHDLVTNTSGQHNSSNQQHGMTTNNSRVQNNSSNQEDVLTWPVCVFHSACNINQDCNEGNNSSNNNSGDLEVATFWKNRCSKRSWSSSNQTCFCPQDGCSSFVCEILPHHCPLTTTQFSSSSPDVATAATASHDASTSPDATAAPDAAPSTSPITTNSYAASTTRADSDTTATVETTEENTAVAFTETAFTTTAIPTTAEITETTTTSAAVATTDTTTTANTATEFQQIVELDID